LGLLFALPSRQGVAQPLKHFSYVGVAHGLHETDDQEKVNSDASREPTEVSTALGERLAT